MSIKEIGTKENPLSWVDFEKHMHDDSKEYKKKNTHNQVSRWIYRGHSNSDWNLETSLERYLKKEDG